MNSEWQSLQPQTQQELKNTMNAMQPPQSIEEIKAGLETTEKGGVRQSIRNCLTVFQRDPLLSGAIAYNILTDRKDIIKPIGFHRESVVPQNKIPVSCAKTANYNRIFINLSLTVCQKNGTLFFLCVSEISVIVVLVATDKKRERTTPTTARSFSHP